MRILVVQARALHLGFLGCYGNDWVATPNLDRLAAEGIIFDQHFVETPLFDAVGDHACPAEVQWMETPSLVPPWNLAHDLLAVYGEDENEPIEPWPGPPVGFLARDAITDLERLQITYAAAVTNWDARLGDILEPLRQSGRLEEMLVCVTASSGMPLGEHGQIGPHRPWLYEEVVHVPLVLRLPHGREAGLRIAALTQPADLEATFAEFLEAPVTTAAGHSLWPLIRSELNKLRDHAISDWQIGPAREASIRTLEWALVAPQASFPDDPPRGTQLFIKPEDRWEVNDVRQQNLEIAEDLERILRDTLRSKPVSFGQR